MPVSARCPLAFDGIPPLRLRTLDSGELLTGTASKAALDGTANPGTSRHEATAPYRLGESGMVVVVEPGQAGREVILPPADWKDYCSGNDVSEGGTARIPIGPKCRCRFKITP